MKYFLILSQGGVHLVKTEQSKNLKNPPKCMIRAAQNRTPCTDSTFLYKQKVDAFIFHTILSFNATNLKIVPELKVPGTSLNLLSFDVIESRLFEVNLGQPSSFNVI